LLESVQRTWTTPMQRAMLDFRLKLPAAGLFLLGDANSLRRLLAILLENAAKYTPPGGSVVLAASDNGARLVLSVLDSGIGIAEEEIPRIFERFYRATKPGEPSPRGSGLGLALAKWIAERHRTELVVESTPGQGSCFSFSLEKAAFPVSTRGIFTAASAD